VTTLTTESQKKGKFWKIALIVFLVLTPITILSDIMDRKGDDAVMAIFMVPLMPGYIIYVLVTGDIHGWQPGPIGQSGRIIVTIIGSWIFWTPLIYWINKKLKRTKER
jgi:hypothetical protein